MRPLLNGNGWEIVPEGVYDPNGPAGQIYDPYGPGPTPPPYSGPPRPEEIAPPPKPPNGFLPEEPADEPPPSAETVAAGAGVGAGMGLMFGGAAVLLWLLASGRRTG